MVAAWASGGVIVGVSVPLAYASALTLFIISLGAFLFIRTSGKPERAPGAVGGVRAVMEGLKLVWARMFGLGAISVLVPKNEYFSSPEIDLQVALWANGVLVVSGALAGFFPAWTAARVSPVEAMRDA